ncbi:MAG TPA: hypothetical protein VFU81_07160 [Thermomicrobiales bacterium]|nr:hypothetical protein [Thermomicrobiales bacterium]
MDQETATGQGAGDLAARETVLDRAFGPRFSSDVTPAQMQGIRNDHAGRVALAERAADTGDLCRFYDRAIAEGDTDLARAAVSVAYGRGDWPLVEDFARIDDATRELLAWDRRLGDGARRGEPAAPAPAT